MTQHDPRTVFLRDYTPPAYLVEEVRLTFRLAPHATRVLSEIRFRPNPDAADRDFFLHGEQLKLVSAHVDGAPVTPELVEGGLRLDAPDAAFTFAAEVEIDPENNTALEGLYRSNGMYCTQCEAEGFRKITFYPDRPDVMAPFHVRIESDLPVLLSNGNEVARGEGFAEWYDPWPKPSYLFALVAGDLVAHADSFTTRSGREVALNVWVREADIDKCAFAMEALKKSMKWDEEVYGREYDLDLFNIVAVDDFNMGAMENKGLNIFNSSAVLASPETASDADFERIEAIIAHEYFHNWTGNRVTCRDWFQLCLKEGLTVFRDQQFTGDMRSHPVKRIDDAMLLRSAQFREDNGPLAHPVRPESFVEINNFYTVTVYEKGAEIVGMLKRLVGDEGYRKALDLYFERHDGQAVTIEDWLKAFEDATGRDLSQFARWYHQAGTPRVHVAEDYADGTYTLTLRQETPPTPGQDDKAPVVIPVAVGLLNPNGDEVVATRVLELSEAEQSFAFEGLSTRPVASILRGFSAPVILRHEQSDETRAFLLAHDTDPFNKWEAGRDLARTGLLAMILDGAGPDAGYVDALGQAVTDEALDPAFRARLLALPGEDELAQAIFETGTAPDPTAIHAAREALRRAIAERLGDTLSRLYETHQVTGPYSPEAKDAGRRALTNAALSLLTLTQGGDRARAQYRAADNMTQQIAALGALLVIGEGEAELKAFEEQWHHERLVMNKWFGLQVAAARPEETAATAEALSRHPAFDWKNPNRFRAVFGALAGNAAGFHDPSGAGYRLLADWLLKLDPLNPQTTARMTQAFSTWKRYDEDRKRLIRAELERIAGAQGLSRDTSEMVGRMLAD
ncbi:aminopeptidase N [Limimaricola variabilis]